MAVDPEIIKVWIIEPHYDSSFDELWVREESRVPEMVARVFKQAWDDKNDDNEITIKVRAEQRTLWEYEEVIGNSDFHRVPSRIQMIDKIVFDACDEISESSNANGYYSGRHPEEIIREAIEKRLAQISKAIQEIVVTEGEDIGVVMLSNDSPTSYDPGAKCHVYKHECFSPLGDALVALWRMTQGDEIG